MDTCPIPSNPNNTTQSLRIKVLRSAVPPSHPHSRSLARLPCCHRRSATRPRLLLLLPRCSSLPCRHRRPATRPCLLLLLPHRSSLPCRHLRPPTRPCLLLLQRLRGLSRQRPAHLLKHYLGWCCAAGARRWRAATAAGARLWTARAAAREGENEPRPPERERRSRGRRSWPLHRERERECRRLGKKMTPFVEQTNR